LHFDDFKLPQVIQAGLEANNYSTPTPIQEQAIPVIREGKDVMGLAQTGTGKTAAFVLPILERLIEKRRGKVRALILAPTRELAEQIDASICSLGRRTELRSATVYGGVGMGPQVRKLSGNCEIVVACPGRLLDHLHQRTIDLSQLEVLVIDEADCMLDMGFLPQIRRVIDQIPRDRQTLLFSATMPDTIKDLANDVLRNPVLVRIGHTMPATTVTHALYPVVSHLKTALLLELLKEADSSVLVFTRTKHRAKRLSEQLDKLGYSTACLQGNLSQNQRQNAITGFRSGKYRILVATDIAARGIDINGISHVINYDVPDTTDAYIHRIGRTGRAERTGDAFTLITGEDVQMVRSLERAINQQIERRILPHFDYKAPPAPGAPAEQSDRRPFRPGPSSSGRPGYAGRRVPISSGRGGNY
jgi:ATP-dependent RNA helicase RhlE